MCPHCGWSRVNYLPGSCWYDAVLWVVDETSGGSTGMR